MKHTRGVLQLRSSPNGTDAVQPWNNKQVLIASFALPAWHENRSCARDEADANAILFTRAWEMKEELEKTLQFLAECGFGRGDRAEAIRSLLSQIKEAIR